MSQPVDELARDLRCRLLGVAITDKFEPDEQSAAAYITDLHVAIADLAKPVHEVTADPVRIFHQFFVPNHIEHGEPGRRSHRVASERVEILDLRGEPVEQRRARRDTPHREAVAHGLSHGHDVRHDTMPGKTPQPGSGSPETRLDLVGNEQALAFMNEFDGGREEAGRIGVDPIA